MEYAGQKGFTVTPETCAIGYAVLNKEYAAQVFTELDEQDFVALGKVFQELKSEWEHRGEIDTALIYHSTNLATILACAETIPGVCTAARCEEYIRKIKDDSAVRKCQSICMSLIKETSTVEEVQEGIANLENAIKSKSDKRTTASVEELFQDWLQRANKPREYVTSCIETLDDNLKISPGDFIVIGGRPSAGKTAFSIQLMINMAFAKHNIVYFSLETSKEKIFDRMLSCAFMIPLQDIKDGKVSVGQVSSRMEHLRKLNINIVEASGQTVPWMKAEAARLGADIVFVDYLGLIRSRGQTRYEIATNISMDLHEWAQTNKVVVIALCQLNRNGAVAPSLSDLRESGQIEQDADAVILLNKPNEGPYQFILAKNKEGRVGTIPINFDTEKQRFIEVDDRYETWEDIAR